MTGFSRISTPKPVQMAFTVIAISFLLAAFLEMTPGNARTWHLDSKESVDSATKAKEQPVADKAPKTSAAPSTADKPGVTDPIHTAIVGGQSTEAIPTIEKHTDAPVPAQTATTSTSDLAPSPPEWHKVQMRVSGSMCLACLKELEDNLHKLPGVDNARIQKAQINYFQPYAPDMSNWADGIVLFNSNLLSRDALREAVHRNGYHAYKIVDKELGRAPETKDLKF